MRLAFQMRPKDGRFLVYLIRVNGLVIPVNEQHAVYGPANADRAQVISDALNRGLVNGVSSAAAEVVDAGRKKPVAGS